MKAGERLALAIVVGMVVLVGGAAGAATYAWRSAGTVHVEIHEDGPDGNDLSLHLPGLLLDAVIAICPSPVVSDEDAELALAALEAAADQLASMPDAVLVDIREADATVRIEKSGGRLLIRVREPGESVHIDVPISSVRKLAAKIGKPARERAAA